MNLPRTSPLNAVVAGKLVASRVKNVAAQFDEIARGSRREDDPEKSASQRRDEPSSDAALATLQAVSAAPGLTATLRDSEQRVDVGSRTFDHERAQSDSRHAVMRGRDEFRAALASVRRDAAMKETVSAPATATPPNKESADAQSTPKATQAAAAPATPAASAPTGAPATARDAAALPSANQTGNEHDAQRGAAVDRRSNTLDRANPATVTRSADEPVRSDAPKSSGAAAQAPPVPASWVAPAADPSASRSAAPAPVRGVDAPAPVASARAAPGERAARTAKPPEPASAEDAEPRENLERIVRVLRMQVAESRGSATIRLDPPELGMLRVQLDLQRDALAVRIETHTDLAQRLLEQSVEDLRRELHDAGIRLASIDVRPASLVAELGAVAAQRASAADAAIRQQREEDAARRRDSGSADQRPDEPDACRNQSPVAEPRINVVV